MRRIRYCLVRQRDIYIILRRLEHGGGKMHAFGDSWLLLTCHRCSRFSFIIHGLVESRWTSASRARCQSNCIRVTVFGLGLTKRVVSIDIGVSTSSTGQRRRQNLADIMTILKHRLITLHCQYLGLNISTLENCCMITTSLP